MSKNTIVIGITTANSQKENQMVKNMLKHLAETKGIPCKIINLNEGLKLPDPEDDKKEIEAPGAYEIVGMKSGTGHKKFGWKITFDRDDLDDKGLPKRHLILEGANKEPIDFHVTKNPQLNMILEMYSFTPAKPKTKKEKEEKKEEAPAA